MFRTGKPKRRIGLDERLRRHHTSVRMRRLVLTILLGAAIIAISFLLGRSSTRYEGPPGR